MSQHPSILDHLPAGAEPATIDDQGRLQVPRQPAVGFIEGDGIGPDIWRAARLVLDAAVAKAYGGDRRIHWVELLVGEKAYQATGEYLPERVFDDIRDLVLAIKGPLTTPVGGGMRSLNVTLRQRLDLYACIRPVKWIPGVPSPVKRPEAVDMVIYRENTEDLYAGIEWPAGSPEADWFIAELKRRFGADVRPGSAIGVKPMSAFGSQRLVRMALEYALRSGKDSLTLVHKGNIMKYTEGPSATGAMNWPASSTASARCPRASRPAPARW